MKNFTTQTHTKFYTILLLLLSGLLTTLLLSRKDVDGTVVRVAGMLYQERGTDSVSNLYNIKVINKTISDIPLTLNQKNVPGRIIEAEARSIAVPKEGQGKGSFFIVLPTNIIHDRKLKLKVGLYEGEKRITTLSTNFMGPIYRPQNRPN